MLGCFGKGEPILQALHGKFRKVKAVDFGQCLPQCANCDLETLSPINITGVFEEEGRATNTVFLEIVHTAPDTLCGTRPGRVQVRRLRPSVQGMYGACGTVAAGTAAMEAG